MDFVKLRLSGFKSFVDATELMIEPGLTGVVGPNGCGKSNLLEALRWVMGETSAKRMRGGDMDDVIFGGTTKRPARNIAEVVLTLDNRSRTAPAAFNDTSDLDISRKIERGCGSDYRINGKPVRARDVQLLFADNASGAHSPALVSQGKVGALIGAKPGERRLLLEDAAGISGLHSRRHEAENRLKNAEANLTRLDDVIGAMETQLQGLKKQARHAARYRTLSEQIRRCEAVLWHLRWQAAEAEHVKAVADFQAAEERVRSLMLSTTQLTTQRTDASAGLPALRQEEAAAAAALQRQIHARDSLADEERRLGENQRMLQARLVQLDGDLTRERALAKDAEGALGRLKEERAALQSAQAGEAELESAAAEAVAEMREIVEDLDQRVGDLTEHVAGAEAERSARTRQSDEIRNRLAGLVRRLGEQETQAEILRAEMATIGDPELAEAAVVAAEDRVETAREESERAERAKAEAESAEARAREYLQTTEGRLIKLKAEVKALADILAGGNGGTHKPVLDGVSVTPGYEKALAAALGEDLSASLDETAPLHWRSISGDRSSTIPWPAGSEPLGQRVTAPQALNRALAHIACIPDAADGDRLAESLAPGQVLVSPDGAAWRWDGLTRRAGAPTSAAVRLEQKNRLEELEAAQEIADEETETAREALAEARERSRAATETERRCRDLVRETYAEVNRARDAHAKIARAAATVQSRLEAALGSIERLTADRDDAETQLAETLAALEAVADTGQTRERLTMLRGLLGERRSELAQRQSQCDRLRSEATGRRQRLDAITAEERSWHDRESGAGQRLSELEDRRMQTEDELERLADMPQALSDRRQELLSLISEAEAKRTRAADVLAEAENKLQSVEKDQRQAEGELSDTREQRARAEAAVLAAQRSKEGLKERIAERLACEPQDALAAAGINPEEDLPEAQALETRLERLVRERENLGPVNLRAEMEAEELEQQIESLRTERADLIAAINKLRQGIAALNKEARERLLTSFEQVNKNFQDLFVRLFGGGRAYLQLTETDDPLAAGLDVYASPPGKRLQILSLLSGGEQALTALSLLFAVFLTNPAPVCVLDEVDAPLDEANVDRMCSLLDDMAKSGRTRFLIITHHRMTMARLDRLYGVTMAEQGVSQLVSVDLQGAEAIRAVG